MFWWGGYLLANYGDIFVYRDYLISMFGLFFSLYGLALATEGMVDKDKAKKAAERIFDLIDRESLIDPLSESGRTDLYEEQVSMEMLNAQPGQRLADHQPGQRLVDNAPREKLVYGVLDPKSPDDVWC